MNLSDLATVRADFPITESQIYMDHAAVAAIPRSVFDAVQERSRINMLEIRAAWDKLTAVSQEGRELAAKLVGSSAENIAYILNTSVGVSMVAHGITWRAGDNVLVPDMEFPSNYLVWQQLSEQGVELRHIKSHNGRILPEAVEAAIDSRTRVVTLSHVQYYNGYLCDMVGIGEVCKRHGCLFVVDGTQSIGAMTIDVQAAHIDALIVSAHKWMLGPTGIGFMALSDEALAQLKVRSVGWLSVADPFDFSREKLLLGSAERFEPGSENGAGRYGLVARLRQIDTLGAHAIEARVLALTDRLCDGLEANGFRVISPRLAGEKSGIVNAVHDEVSAEILMQRLTKHNIAASLRSGGVRISPHYYNSEDEIDQVIATLSES